MKKNNNARLWWTVASLVVLLLWGCGKNKSNPAPVIDNPPEITDVSSSVITDTDAVYPTGRQVRIDIRETSGESDIVSGTIRITSVSQGYDSDIQPLKFGSIFYEWDTTGLNPAPDYQIEVTLVDNSGQTATDNSRVITLAPNPPAINKLVSTVDLSSPARGFPVNIVRSYLLDSTFDGPVGYGWTHSYRMRVVETPTSLVANLQLIPVDGTAQVFNADGTGSNFSPNGDGTYQSPAGDYRTLTKESDGSYVLQGKSGNTFSFNSVGELISLTDRNSNTQTLAYDAIGRLLTITDSSGQITAFTYDSNNRISSITSPSGKTVTYGYGATGDLISVTNYGEQTTTYAYDSNHNLTTITDPVGKRTVFTTNTEDLLASISGENGANSISFQYDTPTANRMTVTDATGNQTILTYDNNALVTQRVDPAGNITQMAYDANLNLTRLTAPDGGTTTFTYDTAGNVLTTTDPQGNKTTLTYDARFNQITRLTDARSQTTTFRYDVNGNLTTTTWPNNASETFGYDSTGHLISKTDRKNQTIIFAYDATGRLIKKMFPDSSSDTFTYNSAGNLVTAADENGNIQFEYDNLDRLVRVTYPEGEIVSYSYDAANNRTRLIYPNGKTLDYSYDTLDRLTQISESGQTVARYTYDALSRITRRDLKNGTYSTYSYDSTSQLLELINRKSTTEIISGFAYTYDNRGNRITMTTPQGTTQYTYDAISQLVGVTLPDSSATSYNLDAAGNRASVTDTSGAIAYTTNELNQYTGVGSDTYTYDANGNMTGKTTSSGVTTYRYDVENRLVQVITPDETVSYTYDPFGRRTSKTTTTGTTRFIHDGLQVIAEKNAAGTVQAVYTYGIGIDEVLMMEREGNEYFYSQDGLGSVVDLTNATESVIESYSYNAYGLPKNISLIGNPYLYTGREYEAEIESYYFRARYFYPETGRFLNIDPTGFLGGLNFYAYVNNNPINIVDPTGNYGILFQLGRIAPIVIAIGDLIGQIVTVLKEPEFQPRRPSCLSLCWDRNGNLYGPDTFPPQRPPCSSLCWDRNGELYGPEIQRSTSAGNGGGVRKNGNCKDNNTCAPDPTFIQHALSIHGHGKSIVDLTKNLSSSVKGLTAKIEVPYSLAMVRGDVPVFGLAHGENFKQYRVEFGAGKNPNKWTTLTISDTPQTKKVTVKDLDDSSDTTIHGNLATWDTGLKNYVYLPSHPADHPVNFKGTYTIRLVVEGKDGNSIEDRVIINVANVIPNARGGKVTSQDGQFELTVPEQAIMDSFRLILAQPVETDFPDLPANKFLAGKVYEIRETGERFTKPVTLKLGYSDDSSTNVDIGKPGIFGYNITSGSWEYLDSLKDTKNKQLRTTLRQLHSHYALLTGNDPDEQARVMPKQTIPREFHKAALATTRGHYLVKNNFETETGQWSNRDNEAGATVTLDSSVTFDDSNALKITNTHRGGNFAVNVITQPFDARDYPIVQFDYRINEGIKTNFLIKVAGRWYDIGFTDDAKELRNKRVNIAAIGAIENIKTDDQWHTARFNLYNMLRSKTGNTIIEEMIMADWDVDGYMKLQFGNNKKGAHYYIDNFSISREASAGLRMDEDVIIIDHFNQKKSTNAIGGNTSVFLSEGNNSQLTTVFSKEKFPGKGHALQMTYNLPETGSFAGYLSNLQHLDLREYQSLSFDIKHNTNSNVLIGLKDHDGHESKVLSGHFSLSGSPGSWQKINIPLRAFQEKLDLSDIEQLSLSFTHDIAREGTVFINNISAEKISTGFLVDDFEREDKLNRMGKTHWTYADGAAAINGQHAHNSPNSIYRISYGGNIGTINVYAAGRKSFAGWATSLAGVNCALCENLSFRIRGAEGNENLTLYLDDGNFRWGTQLGKHIDVTTEWQEVTIPLSEFRDYGVDTTHLAELQLMFEGYKMSGTIYIDDIRFWATAP